MISVSNPKKKVTSSNIFIIDSPNDEDIEQKPLISLNWGGRLASHVNELGKKLLNAAANGNSKEIRALLREGAPFIADWLGTSPLHLAAQRNHPEVCDMLIRSGISTNARTKVDRTPLHISAYEGHINVVEVLLKANAEIDAADLLGMTPLHWAVQNGHSEIVEILLRAGASRELENKFGLKPTDIANQTQRLDLIEILEDDLQNDAALIATENLAIEMAEDDIQDEDSQQQMIEMKREGFVMKTEIPEEGNNSVSKILKEHGITMLPEDDDNNILSSMMESGHSVVLTDVGKQVLDSVKASEESCESYIRNSKKKNFITVSAEEFMTMAANATISKNKTQIVRRINGKLIPKTIKKIVINNNTNKVQSTSKSNILKKNAQSSGQMRQKEIEVIKKKLEDAEKTMEEYREKLAQKEIEVEKFRQQLNLLMDR